MSHRRSGRADHMTPLRSMRPPYAAEAHGGLRALDESGAAVQQVEPLARPCRSTHTSLSAVTDTWRVPIRVDPGVVENALVGRCRDAASSVCAVVFGHGRIPPGPWRCRWAVAVPVETLTVLEQPDVHDAVAPGRRGSPSKRSRSGPRSCVTVRGLAFGSRAVLAKHLPGSGVDLDDRALRRHRHPDELEGAGPGP